MKLKLIYILSLIFLLSGCIKDDLENCYTYLHFTYYGDGTTDIFPDKIGKVNLYVYDEGGTLVQTIDLNERSLRNNQGTGLFLPTGKYHVICWGNSYSDTQINDPANIRSAIVAAPHYFTKETISTNDSLYMGSKDIMAFQSESVIDTIYFSSMHIKMKVEISGLNDEIGATLSSPIEISIGNLSPTVDFTRILSNEDVVYYPQTKIEENTHEITSDFDVLRFNDDNDIYINLINKVTNDIIYTLKLKDFMADNNISVNGINEAFVGIRFRFNGTSVTVNPWDEEIITPGM